jgi:carbon-monoxide dehydrogenase medium subunit
MKPFTYLTPDNLADAVEMLGRDAAHSKIIAGGQSLLLELKSRAARPSCLVSLAHVSELHGWRYGDGLEIGSATTYASLASATLPGWHAEISAVTGNLADRPVRNMGTFGGSACQADPRFDVPNLMIGCDAKVTLVSGAGERTVPAEDFFSPEGGTRLRAGEILKTVSFPALSRFSSVAFEKFRHRLFDAAIVSVCCALAADKSGIISEARISVGAIKKAPQLAEVTAASLVGTNISTIPVDQLGDAVAAEIMPEAIITSRHLRYQNELIKTLVRRAVARAGGHGA